MDESMRAFLERYQSIYGEVPHDVQKVLRKAYGGFARAYDRYRKIREGRLKPEIEEMLGYVRRSFDTEGVVNPYMAHLAEIERHLFTVVKGIHDEGINYVMDELGMHSVALAQELEGVLLPMEAGCPDLERSTDFKRASHESYETLADALERYFNDRKQDETNDALVIPIQRSLAKVGFDNEDILRDLIGRQDDPVTELSPGKHLINDQAYAHIEQLMVSAVQRQLGKMSSCHLSDRPQMAPNIRQEILAFIKFTLLNRWRVLGKRYLPLVSPVKGHESKRLIDNERMPLRATSELLRILHLVMHFMRSEVRQKSYLLQNR